MVMVVGVVVGIYLFIDRLGEKVDRAHLIRLSCAEENKYILTVTAVQNVLQITYVRVLCVLPRIRISHDR